MAVIAMGIDLQSWDMGAARFHISTYYISTCRGYIHLVVTTAIRKSSLNSGSTKAEPARFDIKGMDLLFS